MGHRTSGGDRRGVLTLPLAARSLRDTYSGSCTRVDGFFVREPAWSSVLSWLNSGDFMLPVTAGSRSMKSDPKAARAAVSPGGETQLKGFIDKFEPRHRSLIRAVRAALRMQFPTAYELVYDNYNFFVIGYSPTERPSESIVSVAAGANGVGLCFVRGASLPDPGKVLLGSGTQTRFIRLESAAVLKRPEVRALLKAAIARSKTAFQSSGRVRLVIRSVSAKQRPRRKPGS